jgi:hypothetical protein
LYSKNCPKCGHPALEHKHGRPMGGPSLLSGHPKWTRYCWHPVPVNGKEDLFSFCECQIPESDYARSGNFALIRVRQ